MIDALAQHDRKLAGDLARQRIQSLRQVVLRYINSDGSNPIEPKGDKPSSNTNQDP
ncbi:hypothetical protein [Pelagibius sp.]|uniref:hypothetical protein n=1 Tax=Pelagibius sp. TaxID=1931238 RepID=UPI003BAE8647